MCLNSLPPTSRTVLLGAREISPILAMPLDVGGQDATEAFEDVGHSDEARETLEKYYVGTVKRKPGDPAPKATASAVSPPADTSGAGLGTALYAFVFVGGLAAYFGYQYLQSQETKA
ncbi:hypothetical protein O1611_g10168 [Lasiodiplodia mahajangana]|uniref:Uncharacterized protein n=1 Tax=Lasiodiplodia mahajangana TaxID=1108764 RepID=A0ACC2J156_9PEZI|nr:hypothetical protein O1611_g10168 [Lasiodiplodia mahajangana]